MHSWIINVSSHFYAKALFNLIKYERNNSNKLEQLWYDISGFCSCFEISTVLATLLPYGKLEVDMAIYVVWVPMVKGGITPEQVWVLNVFKIFPNKQKVPVPQKRPEDAKCIFECTLLY